MRYVLGVLGNESIFLFVFWWTSNPIPKKDVIKYTAL